MLKHSEVFCSQLDNRVGGKCISKKRSPFADKNRLSALSLPTKKAIVLPYENNRPCTYNFN
jgi:hypothetical protein